MMDHGWVDLYEGNDIEPKEALVTKKILCFDVGITFMFLGAYNADGMCLWRIRIYGVVDTLFFCIIDVVPITIVEVGEEGGVGYWPCLASW